MRLKTIEAQLCGAYAQIRFGGDAPDELASLMLADVPQVTYTTSAHYYRKNHYSLIKVILLFEAIVSMLAALLLNAAQRSSTAQSKSISSRFLSSAVQFIFSICSLALNALLPPGPDIQASVSAIIKYKTAH